MRVGSSSSTVAEQSTSCGRFEGGLSADEDDVSAGAAFSAPRRKASSSSKSESGRFAWRFSIALSRL